MTLRRALLVLAAVGALLIVFAAYLRADVAVTLANQLWSCF